MHRQLHPMLVLIDVQQAFDDPSWGERNNPEAEANISRILHTWREHNWPIVHIKHDSTNAASPLHPSHPGNKFKAIAEPQSGEPVMIKHVNSAFIGTNLETYMRDSQHEKIVLIGLTTDHCVSTTARMAANLGFEVTVVADATATFGRKSYDGTAYTAQQMHDSALASLHEEFAKIVTTQQLLNG